MTKKCSNSGGILQSPLRTTLSVLLLSVIVAVFGNALAQPQRATSSAGVAQRQNVKANIQRPNQAFWAQTDGPQGGDGIALATNDNGDVFVGTQSGGIFRST